MTEGVDGLFKLLARDIIGARRVIYSRLPQTIVPIFLFDNLLQNFFIDAVGLVPFLHLSVYGCLRHPERIVARILCMEAFIDSQRLFVLFFARIHNSENHFGVCRSYLAVCRNFFELLDTDLFSSASHPQWRKEKPDEGGNDSDNVIVRSDGKLCVVEHRIQLEHLFMEITCDPRLCVRGYIRSLDGGLEASERPVRDTLCIEGIYVVWIL